MNLTYVTREEARRVNALKNLGKARELTPVEQIIKSAVELSKRKYDMTELKDLIVLMRDQPSGGDRLADKLQEAMVDPKAMAALLEVYPYIEFEPTLIMGYDGLNIFERMYHAGLKFATFLDHVKNLTALYEMLDELPRDGKEVYVGTPFTDYAAVRKHLVETKMGVYKGLMLTTDLQARVNKLFGGDKKWGTTINPLGSMAALGMIQDPDIFRRAKLTRPVTDWKLQVRSGEGLSHHNRIIQASHKDGTVFYFCI